MTAPETTTTTLATTSPPPEAPGARDTATDDGTGSGLVAAGVVLVIAVGLAAVQARRRTLSRDRARPTRRRDGS